MKSKLASDARSSMVVSSQKLSPAQRLEAFLVHCRLVAELRDAGRNLPLRPRTP